MIWSMGCRLPTQTSIGVRWATKERPEIRYADTTPEPFTATGHFQSSHPHAGRPIIPETVPRGVYWGHLRILPPQAFRLGLRYIVDDVFREVVESFEPGKHQFIPVEVMHHRTSKKFGDWFFFHICTRIHTVSKEATTAIRPSGGMYEPRTGKIVFSEEQRGNHHVWTDKLILDGTYVSDDLHDALIERKITGLSFGARNTI